MAAEKISGWIIDFRNFFWPTFFYIMAHNKYRNIIFMFKLTLNKGDF